MKKKLIAILIIAVVLVAVLAAIVNTRFSKMAIVGTGYTAKIMCSSVFVSGRDPVDIANVDLLATKAYPISFNVDRENKEVVASVFGLFASRAVYREGLGCTVVVDMSDEEIDALAAAVPEPPEPLPSDVLWPDGSKVDPGNPPPGVDVEKLDRALDFAFNDPAPDRPVGTRAVVVVHGGGIIGERYAPGFSKDTPLLGWSMTKSVNNALVGILVKQGKLDINEPAPVPEWKDPADPRSKITLDQLLRMSSGLTFVEEYEDNITSDCNLMLFTVRDMAAYAASKELEGEPDSIWSYSSGTTNIISRIVRHTVGGSDADYLAFPRRELLDKLGMNSTVIEPDPSGTLVGSSYMYATARDWARFGLLFLNDGVWHGERILPEGWVEYCATPTPKAPQGGYGAQFWLNAGSPDNPKDRWMPEIPTDAYSARGHDGQYVTIIPSMDLVVVRLGFTPNHLESWDHQQFLLYVLEAVGK